MMNGFRDDAVALALAKVRKAVPSNADFEATLQQPAITGISPWEMWALVGLLRHERRQKWVGFIVETKLGGSGREIGTSGALGHPDSLPQYGEVPDNPGWRYYFHGRGCCLTHADGTKIDVDFADDGSPLEIDPWFYTHFLLSIPHPEWSDAQVRHASPCEEAWQFELNPLRRLGLIGDKSRFRLTSEGRTKAEAIEPVVDEINRLAVDGSAPARIRMSWLLTFLGDVISAVNVLGQTSPDIAVGLSVKAARLVKERIDKIRVVTNSPDHNQSRPAIAALAALGRQHVEQVIKQRLASGKPSSIHFLCLKILETWDAKSCEPVLQAALRRFAPPSGLWGAIRLRIAPEVAAVTRPRNGLLVAISRLLLTHHTPASLPRPTSSLLRQVLGEDRYACDAEASFLLYLLSPTDGLSKLKNNLNHQVPVVRKEAAVFLAIIGSEEALNALLAKARQSPESGSHEAACVLALLPAQHAQAAATDWNLRNDGYEDPEGSDTEINGRKIKTWSMDEVMRANMRNFIKADWERIQQEYSDLLPKWRTQ